MAMHKVPQDVEAEDKFFGPLTFKQFLFGGGSLISGYVIFITVTRGIWPIAFVFLPFFIFFTALAFPWSKDQPTEIWLASRIRFMLVPHKRIWNQTGIKDLVTINVPKREVHIYSDGLNQDQVRSRFSALATVVDTRGWAVKNIMPAGQPGVPFQQQPMLVPSDRLVAAKPDAHVNERSTLVENTQDIMDVQRSPVAQQFSTLIDQSTEKHRQDTLAMIQQARHHTEAQVAGPTLPPVQVSKTPSINLPGAQDLWPLKKSTPRKEPNIATFQDTAVVNPGENTQPAIGMGVPVTTVAKEDEDKLLDHVKKKKQQERELRKRGHEKVLRPLAEIEEEERQRAEEQAQQDLQAMQSQAEDDTNSQAHATSTTPVDPAILNLANNDDLNVETLARQAKRDKPEDPTEVIITLR